MPAHFSLDQFVYWASLETMDNADESKRAEFYADLAKAQSQMTGASKDGKNPHLKNRYATLASVIDACKGPLNENGIALLQEVSMVTVDGIRQCLCSTVLAHRSGYRLVGETYMDPSKPAMNPQDQGSLFTYAKRYSLQSLLGIPSEDDDGNDASQTTSAYRTDPADLWTAAIKQAATQERLDGISAALKKAAFDAKVKTQLTKLIEERSNEINKGDDK